MESKCIELTLRSRKRYLQLITKVLILLALYPLSHLLFIIVKKIPFSLGDFKEVFLKFGNFSSIISAACFLTTKKSVTHGITAVWGTNCSLNCQVVGFQISRGLSASLRGNRIVDFCYFHNNKNLCFQDGTFLVRDSSKKTISNPYVLMVLYKDKVYNIQIRYQEESQVYLLGTGLRGKEVRVSNCQTSPVFCVCLSAHYLRGTWLWPSSWVCTAWQLQSSVALVKPCIYWKEIKC